MSYNITMTSLEEKIERAREAVSKSDGTKAFLRWLVAERGYEKPFAVYTVTGEWPNEGRLVFPQNGLDILLRAGYSTHMEGEPSAPFVLTEDGVAAAIEMIAEISQITIAHYYYGEELGGKPSFLHDASRDARVSRRSPPADGWAAYFFDD
jgi:hypothetical protein